MKLYVRSDFLVVLSVFNTRTYHNYETWSEGYEIITGERFGNIKVEAEDLDDAIALLEKKVSELESLKNK